MARKVYIVENLDCANCAAAVERKIAAIPEVQEATLTFATKQLRVTAEDPDSLLHKIKKAASAVEPGVEIFPRTRNQTRPADGGSAPGDHHQHEHRHEPGHEHTCGHEHSHEPAHTCGHEHSHEYGTCRCASYTEAEHRAHSADR